MTRRAHFLSGNRSGELPHSSIWVDTETHQNRTSEASVSHTLWFGYACYQRTWEGQKWTEPEWLRFTSPESFWAWVELHCRERTRTYIFAHNLAFDAPVLHTFSYLPAAGWKLTQAIIESPPVILRWRKELKSIVMIDTLNWWRMSLATLGENVGFPKLTMPKKNAPKHEWETYGKNDVEVIRRTVHAWWKFLARYDFGGFGQTLASQAFRAYRHRFMEHQILIDDDAEALALSRLALYGGRTECFHIGTVRRKVYAYDVNSMYPFVMASKDFPTILRLHARQVEPEELNRWLESYCVTAHCDIETDSPEYAYRLGSKLVFPVGRFDAYLCTPQLLSGIEKGHIKKIHEAAVYEKASIFRSFVETLYQLRLEAKAAKDSVNTWLLKILMNSLYGKFAQRGNVWETIGRCVEDDIRVWDEYDLETGKRYRQRRYSRIIQQKSDRPESGQSHPAIAAHVTAYAREHLWGLIEKAGRDNVLYCDTDSLYVLTAGRNRLTHELDEKTLGGLKCEGEYRYVTIHGPKDYFLEEKQTCKGIKSKAIWISDASAIHEEWSTLKGLILNGNLDAPTTTKKTKTLKRIYDKGTVLPNGRVEPLLLSTW